MLAVKLINNHSNKHIPDIFLYAVFTKSIIYEEKWFCYQYAWQLIYPFIYDNIMRAVYEE